MKKIALLIIMAMFGTVLMPLMPYAASANTPDEADAPVASVAMDEDFTSFYGVSPCTVGGLTEADLVGSDGASDGVFTIACNMTINDVQGVNISITGGNTAGHLLNGDDANFTPIDYRVTSVAFVPDAGDAGNSKAHSASAMNTIMAESNALTNTAITTTSQTLLTIVPTDSSADVYDTAEDNSGDSTLTISFDIDASDEYDALSDLYVGTYSDTITITLAKI